MLSSFAEDRCETSTSGNCIKTYTTLHKCLSYNWQFFLGKTYEKHMTIFRILCTAFTNKLPFKLVWPNFNRDSIKKVHLPNQHIERTYSYQLRPSENHCPLKGALLFKKMCSWQSLCAICPYAAVQIHSNRLQSDSPLLFFRQVVQTLSDDEHVVPTPPLLPISPPLEIQCSLMITSKSSPSNTLYQLIPLYLSARSSKCCPMASTLYPSRRAAVYMRPHFMRLQ